MDGGLQGRREAWLVRDNCLLSLEALVTQPQGQESSGGRAHVAHPKPPSHLIRTHLLSLDPHPHAGGISQASHHWGPWWGASKGLREGGRNLGLQQVFSVAWPARFNPNASANGCVALGNPSLL